MTDHALKRHPVPVAGIIALISLPVHLVLPAQASYALAAIVLGLIAGIYIGFAVVSENQRQIVLQSIVALLFACLAVLVWLTNPILLAVGYVAHGLWDAAHHWRISDLAFPRWYIPFCAAYDVFAGIGLALIWSFA